MFFVEVTTFLHWLPSKSTRLACFGYHVLVTMGRECPSMSSLRCSGAWSGCGMSSHVNNYGRKVKYQRFLVAFLVGACLTVLT